MIEELYKEILGSLGRKWRGFLFLTEVFPRYNYLTCAAWMSSPHEHHSFLVLRVQKSIMIAEIFSIVEVLALTNRSIRLHGLLHL